MKISRGLVKSKYKFKNVKFRGRAYRPEDSFIFKENQAEDNNLLSGKKVRELKVYKGFNLPGQTMTALTGGLIGGTIGYSAFIFLVALL